MSFLKHGFGARNIAMGDAASAMTSDVTTLYYNPAGLALNQDAEIMLMHNAWIQDIRSELLGAKFSLFGLPLAAGFNVTNISDIEIRKNAGDPEGTFDAVFLYGSLSTGFYIIDELSIGASIKYLYEGYLNDEANGVGFDLGLLYSTPIKGLSAAAVVKNLGSMDNLKNEPTELPLELRVGTKYNFDLPESDLGLTFAAELQDFPRSEEAYFNFGGEVVYDNTIALRAGYQAGYKYSPRGFTAGLGLTWGRLKFDYAFVPFTMDFGTSNMFSIQFRF